VPVNDAEAASPWRPLARTQFRRLWIATVLSDVGTWMHEVGAAWLMTLIAASALDVALVQTVSSLPVFLFALPAGALADLLDRRRLVIGVQCWMAAAAAVLGALALAGAVTPRVLLWLTFLLGVGAALNRPAFQSLIPEVVPRAEMPAAVALGSVGFNIARAAGPALGGLLLSLYGPSATFLLNAASFLGVLGVLAAWRRTPESRPALPAERFLGALRSGLRYARHSPNLRAVLARAAGFIFFASALWAMAPLVVREILGLGPGAYGAVVASIGAGAVAGALAPSRLKRRFGTETRLRAATFLFAGGATALAFAPALPAACLAAMACGAAWLILLSSFNSSAQLVVPAWVRARALSVYLLVFAGCMAVGSWTWGLVAARLGVRAALVLPALAACAALAPLSRWRIQTGEGLDLSPSRHWPVPHVPAPVEEERGPVLVTVEYRIDPARAAGFAAVMEKVGRARRRTGAMQWRLFEDVQEPGRYFESFLVESWAEHLRQHERITVLDRSLEEAAHAFHIGAGPPLVHHHLAVETGR
jgi:MFS family permease